VNHRSAALFLTAVLLAKHQVSLPARNLSDAFPDYAVTSWNEKDGLQSTFIRAIAQDSSGYLWVGTSEGLLRFDGMRFVTAQTLTNPPLASGVVSALFASRDGSLWVGFSNYGGVSRIRQGRVTSYGERDGIGTGRVTAFMEDSEGGIWMANASGLAIFRGNRWERVGSHQGLPDILVYSVLEGRDGTVWVGTPAGVFRRARGEDRFRSFAGLRSLSLNEDHTGTIWSTVATQGFTKLAAGLRTGSFVRGVARGNGARLMHDSKGNLWVGPAGEGLWRVRFGPDSRQP
jgi:ligand-binding sensor domain-containing protein